MTSVEEKFRASVLSLGLEEGLDIAVGVSGGGDSMALVLLLKKFCKGRLLALTVDHGLRPQSKAEAEKVHAAMEGLGIEHRILDWSGDKPSTHIQERARDARYRLLQEACTSENIRTLAIAHNAEDTIETFWMRLSHGSGLDGLAGMAAKRNADGIDIIRPLLSCARAELRAYCHENNLVWIEDPSNTNTKYLRVKLRQFEDMLSNEGLTTERLAATLQKLDDAREALQFFTQDIFAKTVTAHAEGYLSLDVRALKEYPADMRRRVIEKALSVFSQGAYPTPFDALEALHREMFDDVFAGRTLGGCEIFLSAGKVLLCREEAACAPRMKADEKMLWDGRFVLSGLAKDMEIGKLGEEGVSMLRKQVPPPVSFEDLPFKIKKTLPALWQGKILVGVPVLDWCIPNAPETVKSVKIRFKIV